MPWPHPQRVWFNWSKPQALVFLKYLSWWFNYKARVENHYSTESYWTTIKRTLKWESKDTSSSSNSDMTYWSELLPLSGVPFSLQVKNEELKPDNSRGLKLSDLSGPHIKMWEGQKKHLDLPSHWAKQNDAQTSGPFRIKFRGDIHYLAMHQYRNSST